MQVQSVDVSNVYWLLKDNNQIFFNTYKHQKNGGVIHENEPDINNDLQLWVVESIKFANLWNVIKNLVTYKTRMVFHPETWRRKNDLPKTLILVKN